MAKLTRQQQQIFAGQAPSDMIAAFGTTQTGTPVYSTDLSTLQTTNYQQGWQDAVIADKAPFLEEMNGVQYGLSYQIAYNHQMGIPEWLNTQVYYKNSRAMGSDGNIYKSLTDDNVGNNPVSDDGTNWVNTSEVESLYDKITNCILEAPNGVAEWSGVTPTGSLTNNQGVVSGFSESNYLTINKTPPAETMKITSFELYGTSSVSAVETHSMVYGQLNGNYTTPQLGWSQGGNPSASVSEDGSTWVSAQITSADGFVAEANQTYNMLATWDSTSKTLTFKIKKDTDATYTFSKTATVDSVNWTGLMAIGMNQISTGEYFRGTIDLSQSYIKINGKMWWQGNDLGFNQFRVKQGLKTLIPNGRNENGTLKNIENNVSEDLIYTFEDNATGSYWAAVGTSAARLLKTAWEYKNDENYIMGVEKLNATNIGQKAIVTMIGDMEVKNGNIVSFTPYNPVSLATKDEIEDIKKEYGTAYIIETHHVEFSDAQEGGANWYRIWSDGFIEQGGYVAPNATKTTVTFLVPYKHNNTINVQVSESMINQYSNDKEGYDMVCAAQNITVKNFYVSCQNRIFNWRACGY